MTPEEYDAMPVCWWSDLREMECGHCLGLCDRTGALIE